MEMSKITVPAISHVASRLTPAEDRFVPSRVAALSGAGALLLLAMAAWHAANWRAPALALVGLALGYVLFQSTFGFAGSFRAALERRDFGGFRAQAIALALSSLIFFPLLGHGMVWGMPLNGFASGIGISFITGAILFGIGMQIGGGCASGTLFALGGGNVRLLVTLAFFIIGSAIGAAHLDFWWQLPAFPAVTTQDILGWPLALAVHLLIFGAIIWFVPAPAPAVETGSSRHWLLRPWTLLGGAAGLAALNAATLVLAGRPWGETSGFTLWGSKIAVELGMDAAQWPYWRGNPAPLEASLFADITTLMDFGIILGAALAAGLSGRFVLRRGGEGRAYWAACAGGLLMGYGARLSDGCNIGAYFSALASGSLSGWVWVAAAFCGSSIGLKLRPWLNLP